MKSFLKYAFSLGIKAVLFPFRLCRIQNNRLMFTGLTGGTTYEYSCNPGYICEYIRKHGEDRFQLYWAVRHPGQYDEWKALGIRFVKHYSLRSFYYLLTARVVISSGSYAPWFPFRKGQYVINTWHGGGAYKRIENDKPDANWATRKRAEFCAGNIDLFLSSCKAASNRLFRGAFLYEGEIMEAGMPRNDRLVRGVTEDDTIEVRRSYGIDEEEQILLYAPTYRHGSTDVRLDSTRLLQFLENHTGKKWRFLYRAHRYADERMRVKVAGNAVVDVSGHPDMQQLLGAADMLVTDYSSCIWDYSFLYRPCFLYVPDLEEYMDKTGFYVDIFQWPFSMAKTQKELEACICNYDEAEGTGKIRQHHEAMGSCETGHACEDVFDRILSICKEKRE